MQDQLLDGARRRMQRAMALYLHAEASRHTSRFRPGTVDPRWGEFYAEAGTALEHLCKAFLVSHHPTLIVGGTRQGPDFASLLNVTGFGHKAGDSPIRTITLREALTRCEVLLPELRKRRKDLDVIVDARNGELHLASVSTDHTITSLTSLAHAIDALLGALDANISDFWGPYYQVILTRASEKATEVERRVVRLVARARVRFAQRFPDDDAPPLSVLRAHHAQRRRELDDHSEQELECPACSTDGVVEGWTEAHPYEDGLGVYHVRFFYPAVLRCLACDLVLENDEFEPAGVEPVWDLGRDPDEPHYLDMNDAYDGG